MQMGFYLDQTRCTGCQTCQVACVDWNDPEMRPVYWRWVNTIEKGRYPHPSVAFISLACCHCAKPGCLDACPVGAISKRESDGIMVVDRDECLGKDCSACKTACPYSAPQFGPEENAKMEMCNFCLDQLGEGKNPICVDACPMRALDAGPLEKLKQKYGVVREAPGFSYSAGNKPSLIFKPKIP